MAAAGSSASTKANKPTRDIANSTFANCTLAVRAFANCTLAVVCTFANCTLAVRAFANCTFADVFANGVRVRWRVRRLCACSLARSRARARHELAARSFAPNCQPKWRGMRPLLRATGSAMAVGCFLYMADMLDDAVCGLRVIPVAVCSGTRLFIH